jgi:hypothetical protein
MVMEEESQAEKKVNLQHTVEGARLRNSCEFYRLLEVESSIDGARIEIGVHSFDRPVAIAGRIRRENRSRSARPFAIAEFS